MAAFANADALGADGVEFDVHVARDGEVVVIHDATLERTTDAAGAVAYGRPGDAGFGRLQSGYVEMANVDLVDEMTTLVLAQRSYQLNARVLQAADQILETINNLRR